MPSHRARAAHVTFNDTRSKRLVADLVGRLLRDALGSQQRRRVQVARFKAAACPSYNTQAALRLGTVTQWVCALQQT
jgi:hypothetical protein